MLSKEKFVSYINKIKDTFRKDDELSNAIEEACNNSCRVIGLYSSECNIMVELLSLAMGLECHTQDDNVLEYFIYDLDFGKEYEKGCYTEADGTPIDISTTEKLYEYILEEYNNAR